MVVTPSGIVMAASLVHLSKALGSMVVTLSGILIDVSFLQFEKAEQPIAVTPSGIITSVSPHSGLYFIKISFLISKDMMIYPLLYFTL